MRELPVRRFLIVAAVAALAVACDDRPPSETRTEPSLTAPPMKMEWMKPGAGDPAAFVRDEAARAARDDRTLVLYVGASWCEPCQRFHDASLKGELDREFGRLRIIEYDRDKDEAALEALGCISRMIPLFAIPTSDGKCDPERRIEGAIKGDGAVAFISPKLRALVGDR